MNARHGLALCALLPAALLLPACGGFSVEKLWPFGEGGASEVSRKPANATEYRCDAGRTFYVRSIEGGAVWLIAPDREIRLDRKAEGRWGTGRVELEITGQAAILNDPPVQFTGCKKAALAGGPMRAA
jgi:hypothetical protein